MSDLPVANYLELAAGFHMICLLANPAEATRAVYCSCGWKSKPEKWPYDVDSYESLVSQVKLHFKQALSELRKERKEEQRRRDRGDFNYAATSHGNSVLAAVFAIPVSSTISAGR